MKKKASFLLICAALLSMTVYVAATHLPQPIETHRERTTADGAAQPEYDRYQTPHEEQGNTQMKIGQADDTAIPSTLYYGTWQVTKKICAAPVYALSEEEIDRMIGTFVTYETQQYTWDKSVCQSPVYQETAESSEKFAQNYNNRLHFSDLGIASDFAASVLILNCDMFGHSFYLKDANTLVLVYDGVFFEAVRA